MNRFNIDNSHHYCWPYLCKKTNKRNIQYKIYGKEKKSADKLNVGGQIVCKFASRRVSLCEICKIAFLMGKYDAFFKKILLFLRSPPQCLQTLDMATREQA